MNDDEKFPVRLSSCTPAVLPPDVMDAVALSLRTVDPHPLASHAFYVVDREDPTEASGRIVFTIRGIRLSEDERTLAAFGMNFSTALDILDSYQLNQCQFAPYPESGILPGVFSSGTPCTVYVKRDHSHEINTSADATLQRRSAELNQYVTMTKDPNGLAQAIGTQVQCGFFGSAFIATHKLLQMERGSMRANLLRMWVLDKLCLHDAAIWRGETLRQQSLTPELMAHLASSYAFAEQYDTALQWCDHIAALAAQSPGSVSDYALQMCGDVRTSIEVDMKKAALDAPDQAAS